MANLSFYEQHYGLLIVTVRPFNIYGSGQTLPSLIPLIVEQAVDGATPGIGLKDLRPRRDSLYVKDAIELLLKTLNRNVRTPTAWEAGSPRLLWRSRVRRAPKTDKPNIREDQPRMQEVMVVCADISRGTNKIGWRPSTPLADGIANVVAARQAKA